MNSLQYCFLLWKSESGDKYSQIKHCLETKTVQTSSKQICWRILMWEDNRGFLWTHILARSNTLKIKSLYLFLTDMHKMLFDGLEWCGLPDYCDVFISCLNYHSDGTHSLQRIHLWVNDVMLNFSKSVPLKKQTPPHLGWPEGELISANLNFCVNYSFNLYLTINHHKHLAYPQT